jgi:hypothetical protein
MSFWVMFVPVAGLSAAQTLKVAYARRRPSLTEVVYRRLSTAASVVFAVIALTTFFTLLPTLNLFTSHRFLLLLLLSLQSVLFIGSGMLAIEFGGRVTAATSTETCGACVHTDGVDPNCPGCLEEWDRRGW